ncbi:MAG: O-sialoglycoprotein endopeptidase [Parcubacteria group bacterium Gr01-1014_8]|nr:MAG: O-sialoglycoprotein endopeptidase [Parcubacteria group bacterium Gr01-1014_8]
MRILGIETSADDTGIALIDAHGSFGGYFKFEVLANLVTTQSELHAKYGGIYPNVAKSEHAKNLPLLLTEVLNEAEKKQKGRTNIDAIAVTMGPGLEPCLWTGITFAQEWAKKWNVPIVPVNHMEGHIIISALAENGGRQIQFPMLSLLISGGHTDLILSRKWMEYEYIGRTRDDAVGEAFDKVARMLGLPYPGGPHISRLAEEARQTDRHRMSVILPRPMLHKKNFDFSFAGLKTAVRRIVEGKGSVTEEFKKLVAQEFEDAVTDVLVDKTSRAIEECGARTLVVGGGVSANTEIRSRLAKACADIGVTLVLPPVELATDNALMIALAGYFRALKREFSNPEQLRAQGNLKLAEGTSSFT